jgi:predicted nucleic acid-binding protein
VSREGASRVPAVLDTSFWVLGYRAEFAANCLDLFDIIVPAAVEAEIMASHPSTPSREYPYATLFRHLGDKFRKPEVDVSPLRIFGRGEAEAIALAKQLDVILLINESPGAHFARNMAVDVVTVPAVVVLLRSHGVISDRAARGKLMLISPNTASAIIEDALRVLDTLSDHD